MASQPLQELLLASSPDGTITAYDASSGTTLARFNGSRSPRKGLAILGNNLIAASHLSSSTSSSSNNAIHLYNWWSSAPAHHIPVAEPVGPLAATFDGSYLFAGGLSGHIHALSLPSGHAIQSFSAHRNAVSCLSIKKDGSLLFSGGDDGIVAVFPIYKLVDSAQQQQQQEELVFRRFAGHESTVTSIATGIAASNCNIISCSLDCTCKFWSLMHGTHSRTIAFPCMIWAVEMDPAESKFYVAGSDGSVYSCALMAASRSSVPSEEQKLVTWGQKHGGSVMVMALAIMNGGRNLATASELDGNIWIWEVSSKRVIKVIGQEMVTNISELVVANNQFGDIGRARGYDDNRFGGGSLGLIPGNTPPVMEMEEVLGPLARDRREAFNALGSALESYEKLLELILKEAARRKDDSDDDTGKRKDQG